jgi:vancomycin resistance protein YoaR
VVLVADDPAVEVTFTPDELAEALQSEIVHNSPPTIELSFDTASLGAVASEYREAIEQPARNAEFVLQADESVIILGSRPETLFDADLIAETVYATALSGEEVAEFPFGIGEQPRFSTEDAEAMGPIKRVSAWTTEYPSGQPRVTNIHTIADAVDGAVIWPGEEWSLNVHVGPRTVAKGYVEAPMIADGEFVDSVGGGVSQFATTFYNAVFYGCYEDVEHQPHSLYFSKYPEVIEATMGYPNPDVKFRNNTEAPVIIRTAYTSSVITVLFYGNNGGKECSAEWGEHTNEEEYETVYVENEDPEITVNPDEEVRIQTGKDGFTTSVTRIITHPDGTVEREQTWTWRYRTQDEKIAVHACMETGEPINCPVKIPSYVGTSYDSAFEQLAAAGYMIIKVEESVDNEGQNGVVIGMDPGGGEWVYPGSTVTLKVGVYVAAPTTTTTTPPDATTTTTTTTAPPDTGG